ncbi:MAG: hypothetical protein RL199_1496 [Pseudomonadota bacterium]|jgi:hypothetical protein
MTNIASLIPLRTASAPLSDATDSSYRSKL